MTIPVTCPSCLTRFSVSDKFAGKSGPCPKCQKTIKIPDKSEEVVIHAPEESGPKDSKGRSVLKPLRRQEVSLSLPVILAATLGTLVVFGLALGLGLSGPPPTALLAIGSLVLAIPLAFVGYWFLHDDELEGFKGKSLIARIGVATLVFAATWAIYAFIPVYLFEQKSTAEMSGMQMVLFIAAMIAVGTVASVLIFELELLQGLLLYMLYFVTTFVLAWIAGTPLAAPLTGGNDAAVQRPTVVSPAAETGASVDTADPVTPAAEEPDRRIPNLLQ